VAIVTPEPEATRLPVASFREAVVTWCRVAGLSFGGPAGQIAVMHRIIVDEKKWVSEERFLHALNYCMLLPGPEAQQLATYIGWLMHRTLGGLVAGTLFVLPGFVSILVLSIIYALWQQTDFVQALFFGLKPAVMAIVLEAVLRIGRRVLKNRVMVGLAAASFVAIFFVGVPFPLLVVSAGLLGFIGGRLWPQWFDVIQGHGSKRTRQGRAGRGQTADRLNDSTETAEHSGEPAHAAPAGATLHHVNPTIGRALYVSAICLTLWFGPLAVIWLSLGPDSVYFQEGTFFSQAAVVTFGGAYSVLEYVRQQAVEAFQWLKPGEMLDGLGMAETTPGPLIMVLQFVGFMGAYRDPGPFSPLVAGILGSVVTVWVTFVPCFFWIFLGAPYVERLRGNRLLSSALSAITAAVVGVVLNLAVWFSLHTLFAQVSETWLFGLRLQVPAWDTLRTASCAIAAVALALTFYWRKGMAITLATCALLGILLHFAQW
jgi:chromate transporter